MLRLVRQGEIPRQERRAQVVAKRVSEEHLETFAFWCTRNESVSRIPSTICCYSKYWHREHKGDCEISRQERRAQDVAKHVSDETVQNIRVLMHAK